VKFATHMAASDRLRRRRRSAGFTLVELMTVMAIAGILAALAGPSFSEMIARQRLRTGAFDLVGDLLLARSEAIKRGVNVTVTPGSTWAKGWTVDDAGAVRISQRDAFGAGITSPSGATAVTFDRNGRSAGTTAIELSSPKTDDNSARCVTVQPSGRASASKGKC
jgi:type IV fimbrial biogenesis protein FimT